MDVRTALLLLATAFAWAPALTAAEPPEEPSAASAAEAQSDGARDFDFEFGEWRASISRRVAPLTGSDEWVEYEGTSVVHPLWDGRANIGELKVSGPAGAIEGLSLRLYDPQSRLWSVHWANARNGQLTAPLYGGFEDGVGTFYNQEMYDGRAVYVRFIFSGITERSFKIEQSFSADGGESWEVNWIARFQR